MELRTVRWELATRNNVPVAMLLIALLLLPLLLNLLATATQPLPPTSWSNSPAPVTQQVGKHCIQRQSFA
jgi:hypothetical protein